MPIVGMKVDSIEGRRGKPTTAPNININSVPKVTDMREISLTEFGKKALALRFDFTTTYLPEGVDPQKGKKESPIGNIVMTGELVYLPENTQNILKQWKKEKKLPEEMKVEILNHLFRTCLLKMANIAEELQLPLPLTLPRVEPKQEKKS